ncbi:MAG: hypothetical protein KGJ86_15770, partial [Chloroflexota bacterium]|nr:hypothetical protein [Chloroflexota bacterium]
MEHLAAWQDLIGSFLDAFEHWRTGQETRLVVGAVVAAEGLLLSRPLWPALWSGVWLIVALAGVGGGLVSLVWEGDRTLSRAERIAAALVAGLAWYWAGRLVGVWLHDPLLSLLPPLLAVVGWLMALAPAHRLALAQSELFRAVFQLPPLTASARARLQARARQQAAGLVTHPNRLAPAGAVVLGTTPADALERLVRRQPLARQALGDA